MIRKCYSLIILIDLLFHIGKWITLMIHYWYLPNMYTFGIRVATLIHRLSLLCYYCVHQTVHMVCDIHKFLIRKFSFRLPRAISETHIDDLSTTFNGSYTYLDAQQMHNFVQVFHRFLHGDELTARRTRRVQVRALHPLSVCPSDQPDVLQKPLLAIVGFTKC